MISDEQKPDLTADDLALVPDQDDGADADAGDKAGKDAGDEKPAGKTIVEGADAEDEDNAKAAKVDEKAAAKAGDAQKWREEIAEHYAAGDKKAYQKELKRLERISDVKAIWGMYRDLEGKFTSGGLVKVPGKDAKPEEVKQFHKALGVPEKPEQLFEKVQLDNGAVIGDADKPFIEDLAKTVHASSAPLNPDQFKGVLNWYYSRQEQQAAEMDDADDEHRRESERALKDEYGAAFRRKTNAISTLFTTTPGGPDVKNENSLMARLMGGRTADGRLIGNDPDIIRWLSSMAHEVNPAATVVEDGGPSVMNLNDEIASIEKDMRTDRRAYFKDEVKQARYRELVTARNKIQARA